MIQVMKVLYKDGGGGVRGILRFYRGYLPALLQGPLSRFGACRFPYVTADVTAFYYYSYSLTSSSLANERCSWILQETPRRTPGL